MGARLLKIQEWEQLARAAEFQPARMATLCFVSQRQLQRFFDEHFQTTPSQWLRQLQCRLARQLIAQGYSNKAAAYELGFVSSSHFCREFKKVFGTTPQTFAPTFSQKPKMSLMDNRLMKLKEP